MSDQWHFETRFKLPDGQRIHHEHSELVLSTEGEQAKITLTADNASTLTQASRLVLRGFNYSGKAEALAAGIVARRQLILSCLAADVGLRDDEGASAAADGVDVWFGIRCLGIIRGSVGFGGVTGINGDALTREFAQDLPLASAATNDDMGLITLLADFHFDMSSRSRLLLAMAIIELACTPLGERSEETVRPKKCKKEIFCLLGAEALSQYEDLVDKRGRVAHRPQTIQNVCAAAGSAYSLANRLVRKLIESRL